MYLNHNMTNLVRKKNLQNIGLFNSLHVLAKYKQGTMLTETSTLLSMKQATATKNGKKGN